jgi:hypothetical protein
MKYPVRSAVTRLLRPGLSGNRPKQSLADDDLLPVEGGYGRAVEPVAEREGLTDSVTERAIICPGQQAVSRQAIRWML